MKQRITSLDLQVIVNELQPLITGHRLQNIQDITTTSTAHHQFLLKFNIPDSKHNIVLDSGFTVYETEFSRPIPPTPSSFVVKLRKHLKTRRLSGLKQVGKDRVLVFSFTDGLFYLVVEFFSAGNILLLDDQLRIMSLLRLVSAKEDVSRYAVGETYQLFDASLFDEEIELVQEDEFSLDAHTIKEWLSTKLDGKVLSIQKALYRKLPYFTPDLISKHLSLKSINPSSSALEYVESIDLILSVLESIKLEIKSITKSKITTGYILTRPNPLYDSSKEKDDSLAKLYDQFHPFKPDADDDSLIEIKGYNQTLDKFFTTIESSKYALRIQSQEVQANKKLEAAKSDKLKQVQRLIDAQQTNQLKGETIIFNANLVEEAKAAVQALLDQQMDWKTMEKLISLEKRKGNQVAQVINLPLNLKQNKISLKLSTEDPYEDDESESDSSDSDSDSDSETDKKTKSKEHSTINVTIDLGLSAYANASQYFTTKKETSTKQEKVEKSTNKALKNISNNIAKSLSKSLKQEPTSIKKLRSLYAFEKFNWFLSNEGYLIISGKDLTQTAQIYQKFITPNDIYIHANQPGSSHVFILNPNGGEVSPSTLQQAGIMALSTSKAWEGNIKGEASWWSYVNEISDVDQTGEKIKDGFRILGEKKYLPPSQLVMGFGFLWKIKEDKKTEEEAEEEDGEGETEEESHEIIQELIEDTSEEPAEELEAVAAANEEPVDELQDEIQELEISEVELTPELETPIDSEIQFKVKKPVRGKKGKLRKMAEKYSQQDEEEKLLRMKALGTLKGQERKEEEAKKELLEQQKRDEQQRLYLERKKERELQQRLKHEKNNKSNLNTVVKKEKIDMEELLNELSPTITHEDKIYHAIPMFAPWSALQKLRYRVKIQPGNTKKGKALQEIMQYLTTRPTDPSEHDRIYDWDREHEILKGLKDSELLGSLYVGKVKVLLPGKQSASTKKTPSKKNK